MKFDFTNGEWYIDDSSEIDIIKIISKWDKNNIPEKSSGYGDYRGLHICDIYHQNNNPCVSKATAEANATLISKAPEMLKALIEMVKLCDEIPFHSPFLEKKYKNAINIIEQVTRKEWEEIIETT